MFVVRQHMEVSTFTEVAEVFDGKVNSSLSQVL